MSRLYQDQYISTLTDLYNLRQTASLKRQRRHSRALRRLDSVLRTKDRKPPKDHPYGDYDRGLIGDLMKQPCFAKGSRGYPRNISDHEFIYRLSGIKEVATDRSIRWFSHVKSDQPAQALFELVSDDYQRTGDLLPLSRYAQGSLSGHRNVTFWTTYPLGSGNIISDAHLLGLTNNWLRQWSVILQCRVEDLSKENDVRVPTAIDAYTELIFHPTEDHAQPSCGTTIRLSEDASPLCEGTTEFVVRSIEVEKIRMLPILIDNASEPCVHSKDPELWAALEAYYSSLI